MEVMRFDMSEGNERFEKDIDITGLPDGVYFFSAYDSHSILKTVKIVKMR